MLTSIRINVGFLFMMEMMPAKLQTIVGSFASVLDSSVYLAVTLYFWKIGKNWFYVALVGLCFNFIAALGAWFLPESPKYLCEKGQVYELERSLKVMAKVNRRELYFDRSWFE